MIKKNISKEKNIYLKKLSIVVVVILSFTTFFLLSQRKEFPVKVGQNWTFSHEVIPFHDNHPEDPVVVEYQVKVIGINDMGEIIYSRGIDTLQSDLENFLYSHELIN